MTQREREREQEIHRHRQGASRTAKGRKTAMGEGLQGFGMEWNGRRSGHILRRKKKDKGVLTPAPLPSRRTAHGVGVNQNPK